MARLLAESRCWKMKWGAMFWSSCSNDFITTKVRSVVIMSPCKIILNIELPGMSVEDWSGSGSHLFNQSNLWKVLQET